MRIKIDKNLCTGCQECVEVCPVEAIEGNSGQAQEINREKCIKCEQCVGVCKVEAASVAKEEVIEEKKKEVVKPNKKQKNHFVKANPDKCIGCRTCMIACVVAHDGKSLFHRDNNYMNFNPKLKVVKTKSKSVPVQCRQCKNALCEKACTHGAITKLENSIALDQSKCTGCQDCMTACPFKAIDITSFSEIQEDKILIKENMVANKCDLCIGRENGPACVEVCPTQAFSIVK